MVPAMQTVFYTLGSIAAVILIIVIPVLTLRVIGLLSRLEETRKDLSELISAGTFSLQHANRFMARSQEGFDRLRVTLDRIERLLALLQPAAAVGGLLAGAKRAVTGHRRTETPPTQTMNKEDSHD